MKKKIFSLVLIVLVLASVMPMAYADNSSFDVSYLGEDKGIVVTPKTTEYTDTDLFANFKNIMPGDTRTETVTFANEATDCDFVKVYLQIFPHNNAEEAQAFLEIIHMVVECNGTEIFNDTAAAAMEEGVLIGKVESGKSVNITATLTTDAEKMTNEYANMAAEVDWKFTTEAFSGDPLYMYVHKNWKNDKAASRPTSVTVQLYNGEELYDSVTLNADNGWAYTWEKSEADDVYGDWSIKEVVPKGYSASYYKTTDTDTGLTKVEITNTASLIQTGQLNWPIYVLGAAGIALIAFGAVMLLKKKKNKHEA